MQEEARGEPQPLLYKKKYLEPPGLGAFRGCRSPRCIQGRGDAGARGHKGLGPRSWWCPTTPRGAEPQPSSPAPPSSALGNWFLLPQHRGHHGR